MTEQLFSFFGGNTTNIIIYVSLLDRSKLLTLLNVLIFMSKSKWGKWGIVTNQSLQIYKTRKLQGNVAVIFSAGVAIISQVARELKEGASVFLSERVYIT